MRTPHHLGVTEIEVLFDVTEPATLIASEVGHQI